MSLVNILTQINNAALIGLLFFLPTQFGKHFFPNFSYLFGVRVDYLAPTIYLTDILTLTLILANYRHLRPFFTHRLFLTVVFFGLINVFFSQSWPIAFNRLLKIIEWLAVFLIFAKKIINAKSILISFLAGGIIQLALTIAQFVNKSSIQGLFYYFGERYVNLSLPDIAKTSILGTEYLRPYSTFSHPNSLAGFYLLLYFFILTNKRFVNFTILKIGLQTICTLLIFLSFSKLAVFIFIILNIVYFMIQTTKTKQCVICLISKTAIFLLLVSIVFLGQGDPLSSEKRLWLLTNALDVFLSHPLTGVGLGNYIIAQSAIPTPYPYVFFQPVHNIFVLWLCETGLIFTILAIYYLAKKIWLKLKNPSYTLPLAVIALTGMFDHYWLTLQQNFLLTAVIFGLLEEKNQGVL